MQVYDQRDPPEYKVESVKVPVATYRGKNDYLTSKEVGTWGCNMLELQTSLLTLTPPGHGKSVTVSKCHCNQR